LKEKVAAPVYKTENTAVEIRHADHVAPSIRKELALTSLTNGGRSVDIVRSRTQATEFLSEHFYIQNSLRQGDALLTLLLNFSLEYAIRKVKESRLGLKLNATYRLLVCANDTNLLGDNIAVGTVQKSIETLTPVLSLVLK
jgi:hypothetical protein